MLTSSVIHDLSLIHIFEDDGRIEEKIYNEYMELGLRYPPTFTQVSTTEEAAAVLRSTRCV